MGQLVVVGDLDREPLRILFIQPAEQVLVFLVAAAERDHDHLFARQPVGHLRNQVEAFLRGKARDDADHGQLRVGGGHAEFRQQVLLALRLLAQVLRTEVAGRILVGFGVPLVIIDAVENSRYGRRAGAQHALQPETVFRALDLLAVLPAHRGDEIGEDQRALQEVHLAVEFELVDGEQVPRQQQERQRVGRKQALVADVVDGKHRARVMERGIVRIQAAQQDRHQRRLPVVAVKNVGRAQDLRRLDRGAAEKPEALRVIAVVAERCAVESVAIEVRRIVDKVESDTVSGTAVEHGTEAVAVVEGNGDAAQDRLGVGKFRLPVLGQENAYFVTQCGQRTRQGAHNVSEAAGLGIRNALGCHDSDLHGNERQSIWREETRSTPAVKKSK